jgi:hypothetical protein
MDSDTRALTCHKRGDSAIPDKSGALVIDPAGAVVGVMGFFANTRELDPSGAFIDTNSTDER